MHNKALHYIVRLCFHSQYKTESLKKLIVSIVLMIESLYKMHRKTLGRNK